MNKSFLLQFIEKYNLGGVVETVLIKSDGDKVTTDFISGDKTTKGSVVMNDFPELGNVELGIYSTSKLRRMLDVLDVDINAVTEFDSVDKNRMSSVTFSDKNFKTKYAVCQRSVIPIVPSMKQEPHYEIKIDIDKDFIDDFIKVSNAIDTDTFTVVTNDDSVRFVLGYIKRTNTNTITVNIDAKEFENVNDVTFKTTMLAEILKANKDFKTGTISISSAGLAKITFDSSKYNVVYYLVAVQNI